MMRQIIRTRFAPSPTGYLHLGHVLAAEQAFGFGAGYPKTGEQTCLLRIEDIDHTRCKPEFTQAIYEDLTWLGFDWPEPARVQSEHLEDYAKVIDALNARGLVYRCFKSRKDLMAAPPGPIKPADETARLQSGQAFAWRLSIEACIPRLESKVLKYTDTGQTKTTHIDSLDDIVLARRDIGTSYHLAVTHDDAVQEITHIVRGADFTAQTAYHVLLQALMDWPRPDYYHHGLLMGKDGKKLSKRSFAASIASMRKAGMSAQDVKRVAAENPSI